MSPIGNNRHKMHVCSSCHEYAIMIGEIREDILSVEEQSGVSCRTLEFDEEYYLTYNCGDDECTGCPECSDSEREYLRSVKDKNNDAIETFMRDIDEKYGFNSAPTGEARARWAMSM